MNERGRRTSLGMRFSAILRKIGNEKSERVGEDLISKAECLARRMWELALGWEEEVYIKDKKTGNTEMRVKKHKPDVIILKELLERLEGKAGVGEKKEQVKSVSGKAREQAKERINAMVD